VKYAGLLLEKQSSSFLTESPRNSCHIFHPADHLLDSLFCSPVPGLPSQGVASFLHFPPSLIGHQGVPLLARPGNEPETKVSREKPPLLSIPLITSPSRAFTRCQAFLLSLENILISLSLFPCFQILLQIQSFVDILHYLSAALLSKPLRTLFPGALISS